MRKIDNVELLLRRVERLEKRLKKLGQLHLGSNIQLKFHEIAAGELRKD